MLIRIGVAVPTGNGVPRMYTLEHVVLLRKSAKQVNVGGHQENFDI